MPGWDCHGLPIENKALKERGVCQLTFHTLMLEQLDPLITPASEIRRAAKATALREISSQREQFRLLGIMADWDSREDLSDFWYVDITWFANYLCLNICFKIVIMSFVSYGYSKR